MAPDLVRDKDGVSALLRVAELAAELKAEGRTLLDRLDEIAPSTACSPRDQLSVRVDDLSLIDAAMQRLRDSPPTSLGGFAVERHRRPAAMASARCRPTDGLRFRLAEGGRVVVRPSGTEPKIKCYLEVVVAADESEWGPRGSPLPDGSTRSGPISPLQPGL